MKKLLLVAILLFSCSLFAQQKGVDNTIIKKELREKSIKSVSAYPNPFRSSTKIKFDSTKDQKLEFSVKNLLGKTVYSKEVNAQSGINYITFYRNNLQSGMYLYSLKTESEFVSKRLVIR